MKVQRVVGFLVFALLLLVIPAALSTPSSAQIGIGISVRIGPPALPVYEQPICPGEGYMWTPGYWAWDDDDGYYWVPGTWVEAPEPACCGLPAIGAGMTASTFGTAVTGARTSASTAELTMDLDTAARASAAANGAADLSFITLRSCTWTRYTSPTST